MKTSVCLAVVLCCSLSQGAMAVGSTKIWAKHTELTSKDLMAIERSLSELHTRHPDWSNYKISVVETDASLLVTFWRPEDEKIVTYTDPQPDGAPPIVEGTQVRVFNSLVVELDKNSLRLMNVSMYNR
jgi:hypothetical protein